MIDLDSIQLYQATAKADSTGKRPSMASIGDVPVVIQYFLSQAGNMSQSHQAVVTANVLKEYKEIIRNTTSDLEEHLQEIDTRLQILCLRGARISDEDRTKRELVQEEKDSTRQCLDICAQVSEHIDQVQLNIFEDVSATQDTQQMIVATLGTLVSAK